MRGNIGDKDDETWSFFHLQLWHLLHCGGIKDTSAASAMRPSRQKPDSGLTNCAVCQDHYWQQDAREIMGTCTPWLHFYTAHMKFLPSMKHETFGCLISSQNCISGIKANPCSFGIERKCLLQWSNNLPLCSKKQQTLVLQINGYNYHLFIDHSLWQSNRIWVRIHGIITCDCSTYWTLIHTEYIVPYLMTCTMLCWSKYCQK